MVYSIWVRRAINDASICRRQDVTRSGQAFDQGQLSRGRPEAARHMGCLLAGHIALVFHKSAVLVVAATPFVFDDCLCAGTL